MIKHETALNFILYKVQNFYIGKNVCFSVLFYLFFFQKIMFT